MLHRDDDSNRHSASHLREHTSVMTQPLFKRNPFVGAYRGASILVVPNGWIAYYPSTSSQVIAEGKEQQRQDAVNKARQLIDEYLSTISEP